MIPEAADEGNGPVTITEFLEARIAEDEAEADPDVESEKWRARVLDECAAKRAIIADYVGVSPQSWWSQDAIKTNSRRADAWLLTLQHLAAVYADHPDYSADWA